MCLGLQSMESMDDDRDFLNEPPFWMNHFGEHTRITFDRPIEWYFRKLSFYVAQAGLKHPDIGKPPTSQRFKGQGPQLYVTTPDHNDFLRKQLFEAWKLTELVKNPCFIYNQFHFGQLNNIPCCKHTTFSLSIGYLFIIYFLFLFISWLTSRRFPFLSIVSRADVNMDEQVSLWKDAEFFMSYSSTMFLKNITLISIVAAPVCIPTCSE